MAAPLKKHFICTSEWSLAVLLTVAVVWLHFFHLIMAESIIATWMSLKNLVKGPYHDWDCCN